MIKDIRTLVAELDEKAAALLELLEETHGNDDEVFRDDLETLQCAISDYQEAKGWLG